MRPQSRRHLSLAMAALLMGVACSSSTSSRSDGGNPAADTAASPDTSSTGKDAAADSPLAPDLGFDVGIGGEASPGDSAASDGGVGGPFVYFIKQANGTTSASMADGTITVSSTYGASGNAFKYVAPNYYGTASNGFISFPTPMTGDFSISAEVTITTQNKANNACGIGLGMTTGWNPTDAYAYVLMRNSNNAAAGYYVSGAGTISAGAPSVPFSNGTPLALSFARSGKNITLSAGPVAGTATTATVTTDSLTDGNTVFGNGAVYPALSFNNVVGTIAKLIVKDGSGNVVFDSATGQLVNYVPAALSLSATSVSLLKGQTATVTATANAVGGAVSAVTAVSADTSIATVSADNESTGSTLTISGVKGGVTTITVTNSADSNPATATTTLLVAVNDYPTSDNYGSKGLTAYPAPGATGAYPDGEIALTFDAAPTLNKGGSVKILKLSDGSEVDSIAFDNESETFGTTVVNLGAQLVRVDGATLTITPHLGKLVYGTDYFVAIPTWCITGTLNGVAFSGLSNLKTVATWKFTTRAAPTLDFSNVTVDGSQTSTANFRSLAAALNTIATNAAAPSNATINVAAGTYHELLRYSGPGGTTSQTINIIGPPGNQRGDTCVFQFANGNTLNGTTQTRPTFYFTGANLVLQNLTLKNTATRAQVSQAETLYFASGGSFTLAAYNSSFYSNQDTLQTSGRNWFYKCYIEGNVDFIWGTAQAALFEDCSMRFVNDLGGAAASYSLVVARTGATDSGTIGKGYVVLGSKVSVDANVTATLARNAGGSGFYDQVAFVNVAFSGAGTLGAGLWNTTTAPLSLGDASYVGWKATGCTGLNLASLTAAAGTATTIANQSTEYDTRDHILNRVVTVTSGAPSGYQAASGTWDVSSLAAAWGAP